ncbi:MAG: dTDP-4-dehydrorhamnose 3,5-epimerase [Flavobacteriales bacterium]|nr:MAG: dTDP-4-dehydrorhamnose 3,5-epimerase [Flavobacteriales bacterium]
MEIHKTPLEGLMVIEPVVFRDKRGYFFESYNQRIFEKKTGAHATFLQDNESMSQKGVLRGLHFQTPPFAQGKLIRVIKGSVMDIAVDIRKNSPTYGQHFSVMLSEENKKMIWVPIGFAHGFLTTEDNTIFSYKCTQVYNKASEDSIYWNDPDLNINWGIEDPVLSVKDLQAKAFKDFNSIF